MQTPETLRYTAEHEWVRLDDGVVVVGVTDFAQDSLGDVVFVELPAEGTVLAAGAVAGEIESTKSVSEIYAPVAGTVAGVNAQLAQAPELVNRDPYGEGWMFSIRPDDASDVEGLLDAAAYVAHTEG